MRLAQVSIKKKYEYIQHEYSMKNNLNRQLLNLLVNAVCHVDSARKKKCQEGRIVL